MNFLAHYVIATDYLMPVAPLSLYVAGNALPDLLPLAAPRTRLRPIILASAPVSNDPDRALHTGVLVHLATDTAFHKTAAFVVAQSEAAHCLRQAGFTEMRVRPFFLAHILVELALDAALLRTDPLLAETFYEALAQADLSTLADWTAMTIGRPLPALPEVFSRFLKSRYLRHYTEDPGVAQALDGLCIRARQARFTGENFARLTLCVSHMREWLMPKTRAMLEETAVGILKMQEKA